MSVLDPTAHSWGGRMNRADADVVNEAIAERPLLVYVAHLEHPERACCCVGGGSMWRGGCLCWCAVSATVDQFHRHGLTVTAKLFADHVAKRTAEEAP